MNSLAVVQSRALLGLSAPGVRVEVHLASGLPAFNIVGLPETSVRESRERVRAALQQSGIEFPNRRITVNLAPADLPKASGRFDLPIAIALASACGLIPHQALHDLELVGELSLSGELRPITAALAVAMGVHTQAPDHALILPRDNLAEAALSGLTRLYGAATLTEVIAHLTGHQALLPAPANAEIRSEHLPCICPDMADVHGQALARRALEISAAGLHPLLLCGSPGTGKSMLARCLPGILPYLSNAQALENAAIRSAARQPAVLSKQPPFIASHASVNPAGLLGGGQPPRPGEISLANHGVLLLDELPEFRRAVIESLREPLETGTINLSRGAHSETFPARFLMIATMNPCPCGHLGDPARHCRCTPAQIRRYQAKLSGPLLERFDCGIEMIRESAPSVGQTPSSPPPLNSSTIAARVAQTRERQILRQGCVNSQLPAGHITTSMDIQPEARQLLAHAANRFGWSMRSQHRALRVARTIADLANCTTIGTQHMAEAMALRRPLDRLASGSINPS